MGSYGEFLDLPVEELDEIIDVNVKGTLHATRAALPHLLRSKAADLLVIASVAGQRGPEGESVYAASKFAQVGFVRALDHELWPQWRAMPILCPGGVATDFAMGRGRTPDDPDLANFMQADDVGAVAVDLLRLPDPNGSSSPPFCRWQRTRSAERSITLPKGSPVPRRSR